MTPDNLQNELDTLLIDELERLHPLTPNTTKSKNSNQSPMINASRNASFDEIEPHATNASPKISNLNQNTNHCHHHLCPDGDSHTHQQHNFQQSRHIEPSETAGMDENAQPNYNNQQNIYTNHPDDQSDLDETPNVPKLPNRPQMMKLPCRNRCTCHERQHHNHSQNNA